MSNPRHGDRAICAICRTEVVYTKLPAVSGGSDWVHCGNVTQDHTALVSSSSGTICRTSQQVDNRQRDLGCLLDLLKTGRLDAKHVNAGSVLVDIASLLSSRTDDKALRELVDGLLNYLPMVK